MFQIKEGNLYLTRGDTAYLSIDFTTKREIESLVLSVKKRVYDTDYKFQIKAILDNKFVFEPELTKDLDFGKYCYDIQLTTSLGEVFTLVEGNLFLTDEVSK